MLEVYQNLPDELLAFLVARTVVINTQGYVVIPSECLDELTTEEADSLRPYRHSSIYITDV